MIMEEEIGLQSYIEQAFVLWKPPPPETVARNKYDVTLSWDDLGLEFLDGELLYRIQRKDKMPPWVQEYSGGKTLKRIDNLEPCCPHKFRLQVIVNATAVPHLAEKAIDYYGSEINVYEKLKEGIFKDTKIQDFKGNNYEAKGCGDSKSLNDIKEDEANLDEAGDRIDDANNKSTTKYKETKRGWLESRWSEIMSTNTESTGTSAICFCMAIREGYMKHVQVMLEERPELIGIVNNTNGFTPLATAVRKGDINMVKYLLSMGAEVDQLSTTGQTPLHLAVLAGNTAIADLLLEKGADFKSRDKNDLRVEHYAVDSGDLFTLRHILDLGGDVAVIDNNKWTPLFRAVVQGASTAIVEELVRRGSDVEAVDRAGLALPDAAKTLFDRLGRSRESVLRLVQPQYPHHKARATFTRVTKKISSVHTLLHN